MQPFAGGDLQRRLHAGETLADAKPGYGGAA